MSKFISGLAALLALSALAGCEGSLTGASAGHGVWPPKGPIAFGDYAASTDQGAAAKTFGDQIAGRYPVNVPMSAALGDLGKNKFACAPSKVAAVKGADPPAQVCRRTASVGACTFVWQVHLFADASRASVARVRGLYDKTCGEELLGR